MREGTVICPQADNDGNPLDRVKREAMGYLIGLFGGCTVRAAEGAWQGPDGTLYIEPVWELSAAYEPSTANDAALRGVAEHIGKAGRQEAVYVRYASGDVAILETANTLREAA